jgi:hypothetical protein
MQDNEETQTGDGVQLGTGIDCWTAREALEAALIAASNGLVDKNNVSKHADTVEAVLANNTFRIISTGKAYTSFSDAELNQLMVVARAKEASDEVQENLIGEAMLAIHPEVFEMLFSDMGQFDLRCNAVLTTMMQAIVSMFMRRPAPEEVVLANATSTLANVTTAITNGIRQAYLARKQAEKAAQDTRGIIGVNGMPFNKH